MAWALTSPFPIMFMHRKLVTRIIMFCALSGSCSWACRNNGSFPKRLRISADSTPACDLQIKLTFQNVFLNSQDCHYQIKTQVVYEPTFPFKCSKHKWTAKMNNCIVEWVPTCNMPGSKVRFQHYSIRIILSRY